MVREFDASYLLRVWRDGRGEDAWRASLKDLRSQETLTFQDLQTLAGFIAGFGERLHQQEND